MTKALNAMLIPEPHAGQMRAAQNKTKLLIVAAFLCGIAAVALLPQAIESGWLLLVQDDPAALADRKLARSFNAEVAAREIEAALAANDPELAKSFVELARDRNVPLRPNSPRRSMRRWRRRMARSRPQATSPAD